MKAEKSTDGYQNLCMTAKNLSEPKFDVKFVKRLHVNQKVTIEASFIVLSLFNNKFAENRSFTAAGASFPTGHLGRQGAGQNTTRLERVIIVCHLTSPRPIKFQQIRLQSYFISP
ncbi:hypothetical protein HI914_07251 [Erysiphe necator]|nr:hypothetical protein HI914_07251 [Erysiphe necator]